MTEPSLLIFKHGDRWVKREQERVEAMAGRQAWQEDVKMAVESSSCGGV